MPRILSVIPSFVGFAILEPIFDKDDNLVDAWRHPIIGWAIDADVLCVYPVTQDGINDESPFVLQPDGTVERTSIDSYENFDAWLKSQQADHIGVKRA